MRGCYSRISFIVLTVLLAAAYLSNDTLAQNVYTSGITGRSIAAVGTSTPAFIGFTAKASRKLIKNPVRITSLSDYERRFGKGQVQDIEVDVTESGGSINITVDAPSTPAHFLYESIQLYFANGGGPCYVATLGDFGTSFTTRRFTDALDLLDNIDEVTLIVVPEAMLGTAGQAGDISDAALQHAEKLGDRFVILDVWGGQAGNVDDISKVNSSFRSEITSRAELRRYGAAYYPYVKTSIPITYDEKNVVIRSHTGASGKEIPAGTTLGDNMMSRSFGTIKSQIINALDRTYAEVPASGAVAGAYVATDGSRGVWKAPANISLTRVSDPAVDVNSSFGEALNTDGSGKSVNPIRMISGKGTLIWGSRTLLGNSNEYRYVPVSRLMIMIEESLTKGLEGFVFEPNEHETWVAVKSAVEDFLTKLYRQGAFQGSKADDAFFVKVGLNETMTASDITGGRMIIELGVAPLKPAEFIVLRIEKKMTSS